MKLGRRQASRECLRPDAQTDGQPENIMLPATYIAWAQAKNIYDFAKVT